MKYSSALGNMVIKVSVLFPSHNRTKLSEHVLFQVYENFYTIFDFLKLLKYIIKL